MHVEKMKLIRLIILATIITSPITSAKSPGNYIASGYQLTNISKNGFSEYFDGQYSNNEKKQLHGMYIKGNYNLSNNLFIQGELDFTTRFSTNITEGNLAIGYNFPITANSSLYTSLGYSTNYVSRSVKKGCGIFDEPSECRKFRIDNGTSSLLTEIGYNTKINSVWEVIPSYRVTNLSNSGRHDLKLTNLIHFSRNSSMELNIGHVIWGNLEQTDYQIGYRYTF